MLKRPQRNAKPTARPVSTSGVAYTSVWVRLISETTGSTCTGWPGRYWNGQSRPAPTASCLYTVSGFEPTRITTSPPSTNAITTVTSGNSTPRSRSLIPSDPPVIASPSSLSFVWSGRRSSETLPSYITRIRSLRPKISSSSNEISSTARPASRWAISCLCTDSIAPTSSPRVGCAASSSCGFSSISRASTSFCWFPPESARAGAVGEPPRTSKRSISPLTRVSIAAGLSQPRRDIGGALVVVQRAVLGEREVEHEAVALAILRDVADARLGRARAAMRA